MSDSDFIIYIVHVSVMIFLGILLIVGVYKDNKSFQKRLENQSNIVKLEGKRIVDLQIELLKQKRRKQQ